MGENEATPTLLDGPESVRSQPAGVTRRNRQARVAADTAVTAVAAKTFGEAWTAMQTELKNIGRDGEANMGNGRGYRYVTLDKLLDAVKTILQKHNFSFTQHTSFDPNQVTLLHTAIKYADQTQFAAVYPVVPVKGDPQALGSALTYARRYSLLTVLGIAATDDDDDGKQGTEYGVTDALSDLDAATSMEALQATWQKIMRAGFPADIKQALTVRKNQRKDALQNAEL